MHYRTIDRQYETEHSIKKSRFIAILKPLQSDEQAREMLEEIRKEWPKARHYCFAWIIHKKVNLERYSDDGEPAGTAGMPILEVLKGSGLENVILIVVRYFGGILLGTGGLVRAYSETASMVIEKSKAFTMELSQELIVQIDYSYYGQVENKCLHRANGKPEIRFDDKVNISLKIGMNEADDFIHSLLVLSNGTAIVEKKDIVYAIKEI